MTKNQQENTNKTPNLKQIIHHSNNRDERVEFELQGSGGKISNVCIKNPNSRSAKG